MDHLHYTAVSTIYLKRFCRKVRSLQKYRIRKMPFINHEISDFENVFVNSFESVACNHKVLIFFLPLLFAYGNFFNVVALVL